MSVVVMVYQIFVVYAMEQVCQKENAIVKDIEKIVRVNAVVNWS